MGSQLFTNNANTVMSGTLAIGGTTLNVASGTGSLFPAITGSDYFLVTIFQKDTYGVENSYEIVKVTARVADAMTISRDYEGIVGVGGGRAYDGVANVVYVQLRWTAGCAQGLQTYADVTATKTHAATSKSTPVDADEVPLLDSVTGFALNRLTWANLKATLKTYFDSVTTTLTNKTLTSPTLTTPVLGTPASGNLANCTFPASIATTVANTFTGDQTLGNHKLKTIQTATFNGEIAPSATTGAITVDWTTGQKCGFTATGNVTGMTFTAPAGVCNLVMRINPGATPYTIVWPSSNFYWVGAAAPTPVSSKSILVGIYYDGTNYWASAGVQQ